VCWAGVRWVSSLLAGRGDKEEGRRPCFFYIGVEAVCRLLHLGRLGVARLLRRVMEALLIGADFCSSWRRSSSGASLRRPSAARSMVPPDQ
jgi:hypothetical protein